MNYSPDEASAVMVDVVFSLEEATLGDDHASALSLAVRRESSQGGQGIHGAHAGF